MNCGFKSLLILGLTMVSSLSQAQTLITIKAFSNPIDVSSYYLGIEAKATTQFSCAGTNTTELRFKTGYHINSEANPGAGRSNQAFIMISEVISAAKNGYPIEIVTATYTANACEVTKYFIHVQ